MTLTISLKFNIFIVKSVLYNLCLILLNVPKKIKPKKILVNVKGKSVCTLVTTRDSKPASLHHPGTNILIAFYRLKR